MANTSFDIVPASLAVKAMRDSGYKNAAYAIAELVDNGVQAGAHVVEILCEERQERVQQRVRIRAKEIAVLDDGCGMDTDTLRRALQFGNGGRLNDRTGIGRFGMGLPNSSISQARRVEVWSWQDGIDSAIYSYLDVGEIEAGTQNQVPEPVPETIPLKWINRSVGARASKTGTLVVWSELDKCDWRTAQSIFKNSEFTIGRIYRYWINSDSLRLRMAAFLEKSTKAGTDKDVQANDPLYLAKNATLPAPWNSEPMFERYGEPLPFEVEIDGKRHKATVEFSVAKKESRDGHNSGDQAHGKHAKNNVGVSVVRAGRELELQTAWCNQFDTRERWWGVQVSFPPALDELFGVPNNKQSARALSEFAVLGLDQIAEREGYGSESELIEAWTQDRDPRALLVQIKSAIDSNLSVIRKFIALQAKGKKTAVGRHVENSADPNSAETIGTQATRKRQDEGHKGTSDAGEGHEPNARAAEIVEGLTEAGMEPVEAQERAQGLVRSGQKYEFYNVALETSEFFTVRPRGGSLLIGLNTTHPAYYHLVTLLEQGEDDNDIESLKLRLKRSFEGLKLLLEAWARYEDEQTDGRRKQVAQEARMDWGRVARQFLQVD